MANYTVSTAYDKGSGAMNEDQLLVGEGLFGVFDGMTSLVKYADAEGRTGGYLASLAVRDAFSESAGTLEDAALEANSRVAAIMRDAGVDPSRKEGLWSSFGAVVRVGDDRIEYFGIGDCLILQILRDGPYVLQTQHINHDIESLRLWRQLAEKGETDLWDRVKPVIDDVRRKMNVTYGALDGESEASRFFQHGAFDVSDIASLVLFTDGLFIPKEDPEAEEDWSAFVDLYRTSGLKGLVGHVRALEDSDPQCVRFPRFKPHDDIAAIGIDFS